jgi:glycosyltransferase involved in cell wall biosynthesis
LKINVQNEEAMKHTFVICAYKESEYLEECIKSLKDQTIKSEILMATSTPNRWIESMSEKYNIPLFINEGESGITQDWNFALSKVKKGFATIAHQDDVYEKDYTELVLDSMRRTRQPLIAFTDYCELRDGKKVYNNRMLRIKRLMLLPLRVRAFAGNRFVRRRVLSLGDPICCQSVTYNLKRLKQPIFQNHFRSCEDWEAWENISRLQGAFVYVNKPLTCHRIHEDSATTAIIQDHGRVEENYIMYRKFWVKPIAKLINRFYTKSEESNELK